MARLRDVVQFGDRASQPDADQVAIGTLYCVEDEPGIIERSNGTTWDEVAMPGAGGNTKQMMWTFVGNGGELTASGDEVARPMAVSGTIVSWTLLANASGSLTLDVWRDSYANYPPTVADTIIGASGTKPALASGIKNTDATLTDWDTAFAAGDIFKPHIDSTSGLDWAVFVIAYDEA